MCGVLHAELNYLEKSTRVVDALPRNLVKIGGRDAIALVDTGCRLLISLLSEDFEELWRRMRWRWSLRMGGLQNLWIS